MQENVRERIGNATRYQICNYMHQQYKIGKNKSKKPELREKKAPRMHRYVQLVTEIRRWCYVSEYTTEV